jgi:hypothetical protein
MDMESATTSRERGEMFRIGELVVNMGLGARVVEILSDGSLVLRETGLNVNQRNAAQWVADPAKTRRAV